MNTSPNFRAAALSPVIDRRFALEDTAGALRWVDDGHAKGKVVIVPPLGDS